MDFPLGFSGGKQQPLFAGADVKDLDDGDAGDAKEIGGVSGEEAGLDHAQDLQNEGNGGAADADIETGIEEIVLVFEQAEFESGVAGSGFNLTNAPDADPIDGDLDRQEDHQGDDVGRFPGEAWT